VVSSSTVVGAVANVVDDGGGGDDVDGNDDGCDDGRGRVEMSELAEEAVGFVVVVVGVGESGHLFLHSPRQFVRIHCWPEFRIFNCIQILTRHKSYMELHFKLRKVFVPRPN
jgi:hypothetical protein